jgi:predicted AAA+ superfamily ATPase
MGVRRAGKSVLSQSLPDATYLDCELPSTRRLLSDPERFLADQRGRRLVLDEVHRLENPSELLKIAADHFPDIRVLATGSSTLGASSRFRDTLAGRKAEVWLTPMTARDAEDFGRADLRHRALHGGLPPFFLAARFVEDNYREWVDAYWAKDILELFRLERRRSFQMLMELVMANSGGIFEASRYTKRCEISRPTVANYVSVLEATFVVHLVRPFTGGGRAEIVAAPKAYAFDTGFICYAKGWSSLRHEDMGVLWEHLVLNELHAYVGREPVHYWRMKSGPEVDFVITPRGRAPIAVECKVSADAFEGRALASFRSRYPGARNFVACTDVTRPYRRKRNGIEVDFVSLAALGERVRNAMGSSADERRG